MENLMDVEKAAKYLGVSEASLRMRVHRGTVVFLKCGKSIRFSKEALDADMKRRAGDNGQGE